MKHLRKLTGLCFAAFAAMLLFGANGISKVVRGESII